MALNNLKIGETLQGDSSDIKDFEELSESNLVQQIADITKFIDDNSAFLDNLVCNINILFFMYLIIY